ncbi:MAG: hypothetical protein PWP65_1368 [Clostridia bacterium]|nr:hypothetical protein [Clostridia bacterium]
MQSNVRKFERSCPVKDSKECLMEPDEWYSLILNSLSDAILVVDKDCRIKFMNESYTKLKGLKLEDCMGLPLRQVRPASLLPEVIKTGKPMKNLLRKTGNNEYVVDVLPIKKGDMIVGGITISKDVTMAQELARKVIRLERTIKEKQKAKYTFNDLLGKSAQFKSLVENAKKAARGNANILITGESGTGKELLAHAIHNESERQDGPFVAINCAAIPQDLLESELFGYESGAFTGANRGGKLGLFEVADKGTIFLDEIGDMPLALQGKVLRVLQDKKIRRIGSTKEVDVDIRVISATNKNLEDLILTGKFREDLYYRLNVIPLNLPPLRERKEDIPLLIDYFIKKYSRGRNAFLSQEALRVLLDYDWPGNVRELENTMVFMLEMTEGNELKVENIPPKIKRRLVNSIKDQKTSELNENEIDLKEVLMKAEKEAIMRALAIYGNDINGKKMAAKALGISLATLYNKLKMFSS